MEYEFHYTTPEERDARRAEREQSRRAKLRTRRIRQMEILLSAALLLTGVTAMAAAVRSYRTSHQEPEASTDSIAVQAPEAELEVYLAPEASAGTVELGDEIKSSYAVVIDQDGGSIVAQKAADAVISPASMTKILTLLVAAEAVTDLDDTFTMTREITDICFIKDCSAAGFTAGEAVPVRDLLYGAILPSGADAALGLAWYVSGSHEAFVERMNEKLEELGLSATAHFTNCVGWYDEGHRCTVSDVAVILDAALRNDLCRKVLTAHTYTTSPAEDAPEGRSLSNWFLRRIEDHMPAGMEIESAKTGYVSQAGSCAASSALTGGGRRLLVVTGDAPGSWACIFDHVALYELFG